MGVVFGGLVAPTTPPVLWTGLDMKWVGWDGVEWSLTDSSTGTVMLPGVRGLSMPPVIHHRAAHASLPGARWRGHTIDVREVFWPLQIYSDLGSQDWIERDRAFWRTLDPQLTGQWIVTLPDGSTRTLKLRFVDDSQFTMETDSVFAGWSNYGITLAAEQPYWEGASITRRWEAGGTSPFFPISGGPAFTISPGNTLTQATLDNPGDVPAHVVWKVYGPLTSATVGVNGRTINIPFSVAAGDVLVIDTSPAAQTAMMGPVNGPWTTDKTMNLGSIDFAPLPAGAVSNLSLNIAGGTGSISATFKPLYYRAW
jgi:hypothetical protein